tara:strand:- start:989 stop:1198 length:210 start_codon:yes stop_codon:yes gene_type:complete
MEKLKVYLEDQLAMLDRSIVATPTEKYLEEFTNANHGTNDFLLMQMSKNYGYELALQNVKEILKSEEEE